MTYILHGRSDRVERDERVASSSSCFAALTIYVLDAQGRIRFKIVRGAAMDKAVDELLAEMKQ